MKDYWKEFDEIMKKDCETQKDALLNSIEIWKLKKEFVKECELKEDLRDAYLTKFLFSGPYCPLCKFQGDYDTCGSCIIYSRNGGCCNTPWNEVTNKLFNITTNSKSKNIPKEDKVNLVYLIDKEIEYLESLLRYFK